FLHFGYVPTYNIMDYLSNIDSSIFVPNKVFYSMPILTDIPVDNSNIIISDNKLSFHPNLKLEWDVIWESTFVDLIVDNVNTDKCFVIDKYYDEKTDRYIIEFHKKIDSNITPFLISIHSRRTLLEISNDLNELNNIQTNIKQGLNYDNYKKELNFKFNTD